MSMLHPNNSAQLYYQSHLRSPAHHTTNNMSNPSNNYSAANYVMTAIQKRYKYATAATGCT